MGSYYGIKNVNKRHAVSYYCKGSPPSEEEVNRIARILDWDLEHDYIISGSYDNTFYLSQGDWYYLNDSPLDLEGEFKLFDADGNPTNDTTFFFN